MNSKLSPEDLLALNDQNEILTLIDLLVLRVECLNNETKKKTNEEIYPTIAEVDQNLIEYLYYLFTKFTHEEFDSSIPTIDKNNFVNVCQTLVRDGCFQITSISPEQSFSESTDHTLTPETFVHEYLPEADKQEAWLVVDLEPIPSEESNIKPEPIVSFY